MVQNIWKMTGQETQNEMLSESYDEKRININKYKLKKIISLKHF